MSENNLSLLTDVTKCIGCDKCVEACQQANDLPPEKPWRWLTKITDLSSARWTTIKRVDGADGDRFVRRHCRHCLEPACVEACIVGALQKSPEGPITYDRDICIGCRYCMIACPFEIPRYSWEDTVPYIQKCDLCHERVTSEGKLPACVEACIVGALTKTPEGAVVYDRDLCIGCRYCMIACPFEIPRYSWEDTVPYVQKCDLCYERVQTEGKPPACVGACPTQATIFGEREELLAEARRRLAADPDKYIQHIWGEREVGGTSVLYISDVNISLTDLDTPLSESSEIPMPQRTFKVLHHMPAVFVEMAAVMGGIYWVIERREKLAHEKSAGALTDGGAAVEGREGEPDVVDSEGDNEQDGNPQVKQS
jgi:Fe-S-cluster-containing dehydrogenase component